MKKLLLLVLSGFPIFLFAQTFYISPTGNDAANGSVATPWKTLAKATATVTAGIIHVMPGTYTETAKSSLSVGVSIEGDNANTTIIKSSISGQWSNLLQLESPQNTLGNNNISGITFDGQYVSETNNKTWIGIWITGRSNVIIHDCKIINFRDRGVIYDGNDVTDPHSDPGNYATGNKFYNNTCLNTAAGTGNYGAGQLNIGGQLGMEIYNNTMIQNQRVNFKNGWPIKYWDEGWLRGVKIYNNTLVKAPYVGTYPGENGDWDFAIEFFNITGLEIYNNNIQGSIDLNYNYKGNYPFSAWIHDNTISHPVQNTKVEGAIVLEFRTESILIENNIINNKTYGITFNTRGVNNSGGNNPAPGGTPVGGYSYLLNNVIRNNLVSNIYNGNGIGNRFGIGVISEGTDDPQINNLQMYNNTIIAKAGNPSNFGFDFTSQPNGKVTNVTIKDNIIAGFAYESIKGIKAPTQTGVNITNNCYWNNAAPSWPGATITGNFSSNPNFDANWVSTLPIGYKPSGTVTPPPPACVYTYSAWGACVNGVQTRTVTSVSPANCVGTPVLSQACTVVVPASDTTYGSVILHGPNLTRTVITYIVQRSDGFFYDNNGRKRDVKALKSPAGVWYRFEAVLNKFILWF